MNLNQNVPDIFEQYHDQKLIKRPQASCNMFLKENEILKGTIKNHFFPFFVYGSLECTVRKSSDLVSLNGCSESLLKSPLDHF